ncbi:MAG: 5'-methylthioadenosine/adenosylhomocysteine nucleosidase [Clostridiales bacterium]|nr:5'-methylthioadenosine/adenosylhomocysteine nucleosidase [Clostridiales bacterium]
MIGIIGAMEKEIAMLRDKICGVQEKKIGVTRFYQGMLWGKEVCLALCGIGKIHAALCAQAMILHFSPDAIINIGVAGALDERLDIADIVIGAYGVQHDVDTTAFGDPLGCIPEINIVELPCDKHLMAAMERAADSQGLRHITAGIATGDQFIHQSEKKQHLHAHFGAAACDMEGAAIAQVCVEMQVPYGAYRAISDTLMGDEKEYMEKAMLAASASQRLLEAFFSQL